MFEEVGREKETLILLSTEVDVPIMTSSRRWKKQPPCVLHSEGACRLSILGKGKLLKMSGNNIIQEPENNSLIPNPVDIASNFTVVHVHIVVTQCNCVVRSLFFFTTWISKILTIPK